MLPIVHAATFCVDNSASLASALITAQSNSQDDTINVVVGTYLLGSELEYTAASGETYTLNIIGGHAPGCPGPPATSGNTVLDGQNLVRQLTIAAKGSVGLGYITFVHGYPTLYAGGALNLVNTSSTSATYVFSNVFVANKAADNNSGGSMYVSSQGDVHLWSNIVYANSGSAAAGYLSCDGNTYINGNTFVGNQPINHVGLGGLDITGSGHYWLANNILWNNEGYDVFDQNGSVDYAYNDIGVIGNYPPLSTSHELSVDPGFTGFFGVSLAPDSPLVNAGFDNPPGGVGGCCDANHGPRVVGQHVDIGALETDVLFRNGYEPVP
ncbi:MAG: hypothetical protein ABIO59_02415 [Luteimonas sp.]